MPVLSFIIGRYFQFLLITILSPIEPPGENLAILSFWWPALTGSLIILSPIVIHKTLLSRFRIIPEIDNPLQVFLCVALGIAAYFSGLLLILKEFEAIGTIIATTLAIISISVLLVKAVNKTDFETRSSLILIPVFTSLILGTAIFTADGFYVYLSSGIAIVMNILPLFLKNVLLSAKQIYEAKISENIPGSLEELKIRIEDPVYVKFETYNRVKEILNSNHIIGLFGHSGRGKTALIKELIYEKRNEGYDIFSGECGQPNEGSENSPYSLIQNIFKGKLDFSEITKQNEMDSVIDTAIDSFIPFSSILLPPSNENDNAVSSKNQINRSVLNFIKKKSKHSGLVIACDDIQWIDDSSKELLQYIISNLESKDNVTIILSARNSENISDLFCNSQIIEIEPLSNEQKKELLKSNFGLTEDVIDEIIEEVGKDISGKGELHWIMETIRYLADEGYFTYSESGFIWTEKYDESKGFPVPDSMKKVIEEYLLKFPEYEEILAASACFGKIFRVSVLSQCLEISNLKLLKKLNEIEEKTSLLIDVKEDDDIYRFNNSLILETVRDKMAITAKGPGDKSVSQIVREYHLRLAKALEKTLDADYRNIYETALHYWAAGSSYASK